MDWERITDWMLGACIAIMAIIGLGVLAVAIITLPGALRAFGIVQ